MISIIISIFRREQKHVLSSFYFLSNPKTKITVVRYWRRTKRIYLTAIEVRQHLPWNILSDYRWFYGSRGVTNAAKKSLPANKMSVKLTVNPFTGTILPIKYSVLASLVFIYLPEAGHECCSKFDFPVFRMRQNGTLNLFRFFWFYAEIRLYFFSAIEHVNMEFFHADFLILFTWFNFISTDFVDV